MRVIPRRPLLLWSLAWFLWFSSRFADAATYTVGLTTDSSSTTTCSASGSGSSCNLRSAISTVISDGSGVIVMESGTHVIDEGAITVSVGTRLQPGSNFPIAFL